MDDVIRYIEQRLHVDAALRARLTFTLQFQEYSKGSMLLAAGHVCNRIWFLQQGITRSFLRTEDDEMTTWIYLPFTTIYGGTSFTERTPSDESIQVLERSKIWYITREDLEQLFIDFPSTTDLHQKIAAQYFANVKRFSTMHGLVSLDQRFQWLKTHFPEVIYQVDPAILASFIRVSRRSFYNLKKKHSSR